MTLDLHTANQPWLRIAPHYKSTLLQVWLPRRKSLFSPFFRTKGSEAKELWSKRQHYSFRRGSGEIRLIRSTREMRRQGEGGGIWSSKYPHCSCEQYGDSLKKKFVESLQFGAQIHRVIIIWRTFGGISEELIYMKCLLWRKAFG